jgi:hypothetical protein
MRVYELQWRSQLCVSYSHTANIGMLAPDGVAVLISLIVLHTCDLLNGVEQSVPSAAHEAPACATVSPEVTSAESLQLSHSS